jgi:MAF protein
MRAPRQLVLASTSPYRKELLARLGLRFKAVPPRCDETPLAGETPAATALRLSLAKARSLRKRYPEALIIGSDQVAARGGRRFDKPGNHANALAQLRALSGKALDFHTAVSLLDCRSGRSQSRMVPCRVTFRRLGRSRIEAYLRREQPYDCAASAKAEALGIVLIARIETDDPTSLIGLPLIALSELLERAGLPPL